MSQRNLIKWQAVSLISKFVAMAAGLVQSIIIARILSVSEIGLRDTAKGIGSSLGIFQHLGLASASTREISVSQDEKGVFKVFATSLLIRYMVTLPIGIGLFLFAPYLALDYYQIPGLLIPIRVYALVILIEGSQGVFNSVVTGTKRFKHLFAFQSGIALLSVFIYVPFVYFYRVDGFFYAMFIHNLIWTIALGVLALLPLRGYFTWPTRHEFIQVLKTIFSISFAIYIVKILYTFWENLGNNFLGKYVDLQAVGYFTFAAFFAKKIVDISDAVTDVNLPIMSEKFTENIEEFKTDFKSNFNKIFSFIILAAAAATYWSPEIVDLAIGKGKFESSYPLIVPLIIAFVLYALINVIKSSVFIPAKLAREMIFGFLILFITSGAFFLVTKVVVPEVFAMAYGLAFGGLLAFCYIVLISQKKLQFSYITHSHILVGVQAVVISALNTVGVWWFKGLVFIPLFGLLVSAIFISKLITKEEVLKGMRLIRRNEQTL